MWSDYLNDMDLSDLDNRLGDIHLDRRLVDIPHWKDIQVEDTHRRKDIHDVLVGDIHILAEGMIQDSVQHQIHHQMKITLCQ